MKKYIKLIELIILLLSLNSNLFCQTNCFENSSFKPYDLYLVIGNNKYVLYLYSKLGEDRNLIFDLSCGYYYEKDNVLYLKDSCNNKFHFVFTKLGNNLYTQKGLYFMQNTLLENKDYCADEWTINTVFTRFKKETSKKVIKNSIKRNSLELGIYNQNLMQLNINNLGFFTYKLDKYIFLKGKWKREKNKLILTDSISNCSFKLIINNDKSLTPIDLIGGSSDFHLKDNK